MTMHTQAHAAGAKADGSPLYLDEARSRIITSLQPIRTVEKVAIREALGRVLGEDVTAGAPVPAHANSAMDGYAVRGADLPADGEAALRVIGEALAGHPFGGTIGAGECVQIMTGAVLPRGADTVVMQEDVRRAGNEIRVRAGHRMGQHVRHAGEDLAAGAVVLRTGRRVQPSDLGVMASLGRAEVSVRRRLRVAFFSTGDELRSVGEPLREGDVYDSNRYVLYGMLTRLGADVLDLGVVPDQPEALRAAFDRVAGDADVVMTTGGVSVGAADYVRDVLAKVGEIAFWKVNVKPGKPMAFGRLRGGAAFFGLPGNPVSAMVTYYEVVQPALDHLAGAEPRLPLRLVVPTTAALKKSGNRREFQRGVLTLDAAGSLEVRPLAAQGSGILRSMSEANCFIVLPEEGGPVAAGNRVVVEPFAGLM